MKNRPLFHRFGFAFSGVAIAFRSERSVRIHVLATVAALAVLVYIRPAAVWWALIALAIALVLAAELFNTVVEYLVDHLHPHEHERIKAVKDVAAGAVLVASAGAFAVAIAFVISLLC